MNTKDYRFIYTFSLLFAFAFFIISCSEDDNTGMGEVNITNPTITISGSENVPPFVEKDTTFTITLSISEPQSIAIRIYLQQVGGDMTRGEDFDFDSEVVIPAGETSATAEIEFFVDEVSESTETVDIQVGDQRTANAIINPVTYSFTLTNATSGEMDLAVSWSTSVLDASGTPVGATDAVDFSILLRNADPSKNIMLNESGFKEFTFDSEVADGEYEVILQFESIVDLGELGRDFDIDVVLDLYQIGTIDQSINFPAVTNSVYAECPDYTLQLGSITKNGREFSFTEEVEESGLCQFLGVFNANEPGYGDYEVYFTYRDDDPFTIVNDNFWANGWEIFYVLDPVASTVTIPSQVVDGYTVEGSGTFDLESLTMVVDYTVTDDEGEVVDDNTHTFSVIE